MKKHNFKEGDLVRVGRSWWHGVPFGTVCRVTRVFSDGDIEVLSPHHLPGYGYDQIVDGNTCRLAKQAIKKERK